MACITSSYTHTHTLSGTPCRIVYTWKGCFLLCMSAYLSSWHRGNSSVTDVTFTVGIRNGNSLRMYLWSVYIEPSFYIFLKPPTIESKTWGTYRKNIRAFSFFVFFLDEGNIPDTGFWETYVVGILGNKMHTPEVLIQTGWRRVGSP